MEKYNTQHYDNICIVDAYSTGRKLAYEFSKFGKNVFTLEVH